MILQRLNAGEAVVAAQLAVEFGVSEDSIRRDLRAFAAKGLCAKVYGGALPVSPASAGIKQRSLESPDRKRALARGAIPFIARGQTIFLDAGSTNALLVPELPGDLDLTVVTNSIPIASAAMERPGISLFLIGGRVEPHIGGCVGARALAEVERLRPDICFLGTCALSAADGLSGFNADDVAFKRALLLASRRSAALVTNEKLETTSPHLIAPLAAIDHLIVEHDAPATVLAQLRARGASVVVARAPDPLTASSASIS